MEHDGLDRLWEENVNWRKIDPMGEADTLTEDEVAADDYRPVLHDELNFHPVNVHDLIGDEDLLDATGVKARAEFREI